jgi:hypothetical protein
MSDYDEKIPVFLFPNTKKYVLEHKNIFFVQLMLCLALVGILTGLAAFRDLSMSAE